MEKDLLELGFKKEYNWFILRIDEEKEIQVYNGMVRLIPKNADDWDCLEKSLEDYKKKLQVAEKALNGILKWQEDVDGDWDYPETIASNALEKLAKIDGF